MEEDTRELSRKLKSSFRMSDGSEIFYYSLPAMKEAGIGDTSALPYSIRVVLESLARNYDGKGIKLEDVKELANWNPKNPSERDIPFKVARVLMQDFTGVPAVVDLAAMRKYVSGINLSPELIQPLMPVDLIIDHSVQVDVFNSSDALVKNQEMEMKRNWERYKLLKWASSSMDNFRVFPPSSGICHQVNLEYIATCVSIKNIEKSRWAFPDTLVGTDSHTTMINGLGVVGFGVGGIEAEAAVLGQPVSFITPKVLGVKLEGKLGSGVTATDFALTLTKILREHGVVNMFVEFYGPGLNSLSLPDRATLSNMCPEYGATIAIFPPDNETLRYMKSTGRSDYQVELVERYMKAQGMFDIDYSKVRYSDVITVDLGSIKPSVSGPSQPKQEMPLSSIASNFNDIFLSDNGKQANGLSTKDYTRWSGESETPENGPIKNAPKRGAPKSIQIKYDDYSVNLSDGDVIIASITSCTNTSNPSVMVGAGLLAKKALEKGLSVDTRKVKTSFGPGSRVVIDYLKTLGLIEPLQKLGFGLVGFGCITCIGNSGPLIEKQSEAINSSNLTVASVLSGNRNYEARIHRDVRANYLMSPPLVVAFAIAGTVLKDLENEPLAKNGKGEDIYLKDIWPSHEEINQFMGKAVSPELFKKEYGADLFKVNSYWNAIEGAAGIVYEIDENSTYIKLPPFFDSFDPMSETKIAPIDNAAVLAVFGDSLSTDHISPAGAIGKDSPAGRYLQEKGIAYADFNTYGSRRGNHEVMMRGTFANNRIKNLLLPGTEGGMTLHFSDNEKLSIYDAAMKYAKEKRPLVVFAGSEYGSGSSRDWAAKGPMLLGVKAVVAKSFERIHRSNLVGMGILPLQFKNGEDAGSLQIDFSKPVSIHTGEGIKPREEVKMSYTSASGEMRETILLIRIDTDMELGYYKAGGILNYVLKEIAFKNRS